ncbi:Two-component sensor histidine kinase, contains HisKA and HATPase domains [Nakamurella panacisegetis]|uniref:histidine kinase n=1 Tax=Nakamurella panacisegetis TaxID=1090615 RepID=A0A1H0I4X1_9ACTN|nr:Two-component sensor histidine kinase, contains HisKA and HATPase domains [Nakamurella panacisegetis]
MPTDTATPDDLAHGPGWICVAQVRPTTGATAHLDDMVTVRADPGESELLQDGWDQADIVSESELGELDAAGVPLRPAREPRSRTHRREVVPVRHHEVIVAVVTRDTGRLVGREASMLETAYVDAAEDLFRMVTDGTFPPAAQTGEIHTGPRAGDGLLRLDADGRVVYVSPNAVSAYHRMNLTGPVMGGDLATLTRKLIADPFDAAELAARISGAVQGRSSLRMEVEVRAATVLFRALPLRPRGRPSGALVLVRDVTEVRRRDRALLSKDATIREIHHRVKNNLQTVAALLRLQARRSKEGAVKHALSESVRRVSSIALVHDTLSLSPDDRVDLDQIVDKLVPIVAEVASAETRARVKRIGSFGIIGAELATPLVMVLAEVVQNALEHGYREPRTDAEVVIGVDRSARSLDIRVVDNGIGLPTGFSLEKGAGLGLQIVRTLVDAELLGSIGMRRRDDAPGTEVLIRIPLRGRT